MHKHLSIFSGLVAFGLELEPVSPYYSLVETGFCVRHPRKERGRPIEEMPSEIEKAEAVGGGSCPSHFVALGASAGGLEALETFFSNMPAENGFGFIVIQHLSPDYKSLMVELLSKRTRMTVHRAGDGMEVAPDSVYLIPPKKNLTIFHGKLMLSDQEQHRGINLPIDIFFRSLAEDQGERAVGIVLSGTGSDGMRGIRSIKEHGGMVMVQDQNSAKFDGMPRAALSTGLADFVLEPEEMPRQLMAFTKHRCVSKPEAETPPRDDDALSRIFAALRGRFGTDFTYYKPSTVLRRIERRMTVNQIDDIGAYADHLRTYGGEAAALYRELLIGVTSFFRDPKAFTALQEKWLPDLLERPSDGEIRVWTAGCSTGEEAYSLAILLKEAMETHGRHREMKIFATDIDRDAILTAGNGRYPESIAADLSPRLLSKYFYAKDDNFKVVRSIRENVVFAQHNLLRDPPFTNIDLISCRNLLIYLQPVLQKKVLGLFNYALNPGGLLLLGTSETPGEMGHAFEPLDAKMKIYRSRGRYRGSREPGDDMGPGGFKPYPMLRGRDRRAAVEADEENLFSRFIRTISDDILPLAVIVNERMAVQQVFGDTEGILKLPTGRLVNDISKMAVQELTVPLTLAIQKAFRKNREVLYANIRLRRGEETRLFRLRVRPLVQNKGQEPLAAVFIERTASASDSGEPAAPILHDLDQETEQRIRDMEQEIQFTRENLQATIEELETANEELQATNEELLASNEELQSTNEELQSTNEELYTVNAEYQNKIIELTELNNDVENLLSSTMIEKILLDENLEIRKFSPNITEIYNILDKDVGRPIGHLNHYLAGVDPAELAREVQRTKAVVEREARTGDGRWYLLRVLPYHIGPGTFSGVVMTFIDISQIKETQKALSESETVLRETARLARVGSWEYHTETGEQRWSEETFRIHEMEPGRQPPPEEGIEFYAPEHRPIITEAFRRACADGIPYDLVLSIVTAKGNRRWVRAIGRPEKKDGRVRRVWGAFQDITEQKEGETALKAALERLDAGGSAT